MITDNRLEPNLPDIVHRLQDCRTDLEHMKDELYTETYKKVRKEISTAISAINRSEKELYATRPMEGQIMIEDLDL